MTSLADALSRLRRAVGPAGEFKLCFAILLIVAALTFTYTGSDGHFPHREFYHVLVHMMAVCGILLVGLMVLPWRGISNAALALATLAGVFTGHVVHTELLHPDNRASMILVLAASLFALFTAFRVIESLRHGGIVLTGAAALAVVAGCWPKLLAGLKSPGGLLDIGSPAMWTVLAAAGAGAALVLYALSRRGVRLFRSGNLALLAMASFLATLILGLRIEVGEGGSNYYGDGWTDHPNVRSVTFEETPNLYFVGFDSISPEAIVHKHMGIRTTRFHRLMEGEMRRFRNLFANAVRTRHSLNTMLALDQDIYHEYGTVRRPSYLAGHDLSPLVWLLRRNGYQTTSIFPNTHFGYTQGPHIDHYVVNSESVLCELLDESIRPLAFGGYCWKRKPPRLAQSDFLVRQLAAVDRTGPQFVIAHAYLPGHTARLFDYRNREDRERFASHYEAAFNRAAIQLRQIVEHLGANDPDSILFVYGDHGAWLSRGFDVEDDPAFFLHAGPVRDSGRRVSARPVRRAVRRGRAEGLHDISGRGTRHSRMSDGWAESPASTAARPVLGGRPPRRPFVRLHRVPV